MLNYSSLFNYTKLTINLPMCESRASKLCARASAARWTPSRDARVSRPPARDVSNRAVRSKTRFRHCTTLACAAPTSPNLQNALHHPRPRTKWIDRARTARLLAPRHLCRCCARVGAQTPGGSGNRQKQPLKKSWKALISLIFFHKKIYPKKILIIQ